MRRRAAVDPAVHGREAVAEVVGQDAGVQSAVDERSLHEVSELLAGRDFLELEH